MSKEKQKTNISETPEESTASDNKNKKIKKKPIQVVKSVVSWVFGIFICLILVLEISTVITSSSNHNVPQLFGYSFLRVLTDSMETSDKTRTINVGDGIIIQKVDLKDLKVDSGTKDNWNLDGDVITFEAEISLNGQKYLTSITHRVMEIDYDQTTGEPTTIYCMGDNVHAQTCPVSGCDYEANRNVVKPSAVIGKVIYVSSFIGAIIYGMSSGWFFLICVGIPLLIIIIWSVLDIIKAAKYKEAPDYLQTSANNEVKQKYKDIMKAKLKGEIKLTHSNIENEAIEEQKRLLKEKIKKDLAQGKNETDIINTNLDNSLCLPDSPTENQTSEEQKEAYKEKLKEELRSNSSAVSSAEETIKSPENNKIVGNGRDIESVSESKEDEKLHTNDENSSSCSCMKEKASNELDTTLSKSQRIENIREEVKKAIFQHDNERFSTLNNIELNNEETKGS